MTEIAIIGAGAAGCFCAAELSRRLPGCHITIYEAAARPMAKLSVTGGGRCNITNTFEDISSLSEVYPRGSNVMKRCLKRFSWQDCLDWFGRLGIEFTAQEDHCIFPASQDAMQIVRALEKEMQRGGVRLLCGCRVVSINKELNIKYLSGGREHAAKPDAVVLTSGGGSAGILAQTETELVPPVPSLFTLKTDDAGLRALMGTVVEKVVLGIAGTKYRSSGTLLLTDWGVSGPATLKLSSYAARYLSESGYKGTLLVNWLGTNESGVRQVLDTLRKNGNRMIVNSHPAELSERLWRHLVARAKIREDCRWSELGSKGMARLASTLLSDNYTIIGRARFKEEFVTCGGVALSDVRPDTMESRKVNGLYFAGEVLDIDAITGGFNLQAAWSTAFTAAEAISKTFSSQP